ncbi:hypothetical protein QBC39DRAFT_281864 [Podospora conica]|nr:hypothetical protein QBC39DRAFT_281864 [Schizothecium conicum]
MTAPLPLPRFLLPQTSSLWRTTTTRTTRRLASTKTPPPKGTVLAQPERFNPPSHGARLPRNRPRPVYGGDLTEAEVLAQVRKEYPGLMAPMGSVAYRIIYSKWIHMTITLGTLTALSIYTFSMNLRTNSPHADLLPSRSDFLAHPIDSVGMVFEVLRLDAEVRSAETGARRTREVDDVERRARYRKAHGLPAEQGIASWLPNGGKRVEPEPEAAAAEVAVRAEVGGEGVLVGREEAVVPAAGQEPRKKWLGLF